MRHVIALLAIAALGTPAASFDIFEFTNACGDNGWFTCCPLVDERGEPIECGVDQFGNPLFAMTNNWGRVGPCGECPTEFPGPEDVVIVEDFVAILGGVNVSVDSVESAAGDGGIEMSNAHLSAAGDIVVFRLSTNFGTGTIGAGGFFAVSVYDLNSATSTTTAGFGTTIGGGSITGGAVHAFHGDVTQTGKVDWRAGAITCDPDWTIHGELNCSGTPAQSNRTFACPLVRCPGDLCFTNDAPQDGTVEFDFTFGTRFELQDPGSLRVGADTRVNLFGGGCFSSTTPFDVDGALFFGGSGEGVRLEDGSCSSGDGRVIFGNCTIPPGADVCVERATVSGALDCAGTLDAGALSCANGSVIDGAGTGVITVTDWTADGSMVVRDVAFEIAGSSHGPETGPDPVHSIEDAIITWEPGAFGTHAGTFQIEAPDPGERATLDIEPLVTVVLDGPTTMTGHFGAQDRQTIEVGGELVVRDDATITSFLRFLVEPTGRITVGCGNTSPADDDVELKLFSEVDLRGSIEVCPRGTLSLFGNEVLVDGAGLDVAGTLRTAGGFDQSIEYRETELSIGIVGLFEQTRVTSDAAFLAVMNEGGARWTDSSIRLLGPVSFEGPGTTELDGTEVVPGGGGEDERLTLGAGYRLRATGAPTSISVPVQSNGARLAVDGTDLSIASLEGTLESFEDRTSEELMVQLLNIIAVSGIVEAHGQPELARKLAFRGLQILNELRVRGFPAAGPGLPPEYVLSVENELVFHMTDESLWSWENNAVLEVTGGVGAEVGDWSAWARLEVGGLDVDDDSSGFTENFDLRTLRIGPGASVVLQDAVDNGNRGANGEPEALYVDVLEFTDTAGTLNRNGIDLRFGALHGDAAQIIDTALPAPCPADLDGSGEVGFGDVLAILATWGPCAECTADLDLDGSVGFPDLLIVLAAWGACP